MARIDVSALIIDPDFAEPITRIQRLISINEYGESVLAETSGTIYAVVQNDGQELLDKLPEGARLSDALTVYYRGELTPERAGGYGDIVVWGGKRYVVREVTENYLNWGAGFTKAICILEAVNNG